MTVSKLAKGMGVFKLLLLVLSRASGRSRKKKSNFAGFSGTNSRKKRPISREFRGNFRGQFGWKRLTKNGRFRESFSNKFRWKAIGFAPIRGMFSLKLDAFIALLRLHTAIWNRTLQVSSLNIIKTIKESGYQKHICYSSCFAEYLLYPIACCLPHLRNSVYDDSSFF